MPRPTDKPFFTAEGYQKIRLPHFKARAKKEGKFKLQKPFFDACDLIYRLGDYTFSSETNVRRSFDNYSYITVNNAGVDCHFYYYLGHIRAFKTSLSDKALASDIEPSLQNRLASFKLLKQVNRCVGSSDLFITITKTTKQKNRNEYELEFKLHSDKNNVDVLESSHNEGAFYTRKGANEGNLFKVGFTLDSGTYKLYFIGNVKPSYDSKVYQHANIAPSGSICFGGGRIRYTSDSNETISLFFTEFLGWFKNMGILSPHRNLTELRLYKKPASRLLLLSANEKQELQTSITLQQKQVYDNWKDILASTKPSNNTQGSTDNRYNSLEQKYKNLIERGLLSLDDAWALQNNNSDNSGLPAIESLFDGYITVESTPDVYFSDDDDDDDLDDDAVEEHHEEPAHF